MKTNRFLRTVCLALTITCLSFSFQHNAYSSEVGGGDGGPNGGPGCPSNNNPPSTHHGVRFGVLPIGWLDADISDVIINQGESCGKDCDKKSPGSGKMSFAADDPDAGYREIKTSSFNLELGVYGGWYSYNGTFASTLLGAGFAIIPVDGSAITENRKVVKDKDGNGKPDLLVPAKYTALSDWQPHDSVLYYNRGGIIFSVGVGYAFTGLSGDYFAAGDWSTYIEKLDGNKVYVKMTNAKLTSLDRMVGNFATYAMLSDFKKTDKIFSFVFNLSDPRAQVAYEAMIHGSIKEAQELNAKDATAADLVLTDTGGNYGTQSKFFFGLPFLNFSDTSGNLVDFSDVVMDDDKSTSNVEYGLYWKEDKSNVFGHHESSSQNFYGTSYSTSYPSSQKKDVDSGKYGTFILSYENDGADNDTIQDAIYNMIERTGLRDQIQMGDIPKNISGYVHLTLTVGLPETTTRNLMDVAVHGRFAHADMERLIRNYFDNMKDPEQLCSNETDGQTVSDCQQEYMDESNDAMDDLHNALASMTAADKAGDQAAFVKAYALFGEAMLKNEFTFTMAAALGHGGMVNVTLEAEGTKISKLSTDASYIPIAWN